MEAKIEFEIALATARYEWIKVNEVSIPEMFDHFFWLGWDAHRFSGHLTASKPKLATDAEVEAALLEDNLDWKWKNEGESKYGKESH